MNRANSKPADLILRMYESVIFPGKCIHLTGEKRRSLRSVWAYDISYLYPRMEDGIDWMKFGLFESQKLDRKVPFYNRQQELFLKMAEKSSWIEQFVEYPEEIVYEEEFTLTFTPDYMMVLEDGSVVMVMLVPYHLFSTQTVQRKWYALMEYCKIHGYGCVLFDMVRGISLKWLLHLWEKKEMEKFEKEVLETMDDRKSHWINSITLGKIMKKHGANLCDIQVLVFRNRLLYVPKGQKRKIGLIRQYTDDMFDSQLIIDAHDKDYHTSRRDSLRVICQLRKLGFLEDIRLQDYRNEGTRRQVLSKKDLFFRYQAATGWTCHHTKQRKGGYSQQMGMHSASLPISED